ncbi:MAG: hypothetical protein ACPG6V_03760 [Flavobacteriales bacterium]
MFTNTKRLIFSLILGAVFLNSCVKELTDDIDDLQTGDYIQNWIFPLINSDIQMTDLDTTNIKVYSDGTVYYTSQVDSVVMIHVDSVFQLSPSQADTQTFHYENVNTKAFSETKLNSLASILGANPTLGNGLLSQLGSTTNAASVTEGAFGTHSFPVINEIGQVLYSEGLMDVKIDNQTNIPLTDVKLVLRNTSSGLPIGTVFFPLVDANSSEIQQINMANKTLEELVEFDIETLSSPGTTTPVLVDLLEPVEVTISSNTSMYVDQGMAMFDQPMFDFNFHFEIKDEDDNSLSEEITEVKLKAGTLRYVVQSFMSAPIEMNNEIVGSTNGAGPITFSELYTAGPDIAFKNISLAGYTFDLTNNPAQLFNNITVNFAPDHAVPVIRNNFNSRDSMIVRFIASDLEFEYIKGRFGQKTFTIDSNFVEWDDEIFPKISGNIKVKDSKINLHSKTNMGLDFGGTLFGHVIDINSNTLDMNFTAPYELNGPEISEFGQVKQDVFVYNNTNSNCDDLVSFLPNSMNAGSNVTTNLSNASRECFITDDGFAQIDVEFETPLNFIADTLFYADTLSYDNEDLKDIADMDTAKFINSMFLHLYVKNDIPLNIEATISVIDSISETKDSLLTTIAYPEIIEAADVDADGNTLGTKTFKTVLELSKEQRIFIENADKLLIRAGAITAKNSGNSPYVRIKEDDHFIINISVEIQNHIPVE